MDEIVIVLASFVFIIGYFGIFDKLLSKLHSAIFITIWLSIHFSQICTYVAAKTRGQTRSENAENIHKIFEMISSFTL